MTLRAIFTLMMLVPAAAFARQQVPDCVPSMDPSVPPCKMDQSPVAPAASETDRKKHNTGKNGKQRDRVVVYNKGSKR